jgi:hypothetical protein
MARVKTDDEQMEKAHAFADALDAMRAAAPTTAMRLGAIIDALSAARQDASVQFDFGGFEPSDVKSYRGYYSDLAIGFSDNGLDLPSLLNELRQADGGTFEGYKGGDYRMSRDTPVWVANYGNSHGVAVVAVEDQDWRVVLRTALID